MKKFARLLALVLAGTMMLAMTACTFGSVPESTEQKVLREINAYREELGYAQMEEVPELSAAEAIIMNYFKENQKTVLPNDEKTDAVWDAYNDKAETMKGEWGYSKSDYGYDYSDDFEEVMLVAEVPADEAALKAQIRSAVIFGAPLYKDCNGIGIATAEIEGKLYWVCSIYQAKNK